MSFLSNLNAASAARDINGGELSRALQLLTGGVPAVLGGSDQLHFCVMQMLHQRGP